MAGHGEKLGRKGEAAVVALLSQRTIDDAARVACIGTRTLLRWLRMPEFQAAYHTARRQAVGQATARLQHASGAAVSLLLTVLLDGNAPTASRVRAAHTVLEMAYRGVEIEDLEARLAELETAVASKRLIS